MRIAPLIAFALAGCAVHPSVEKVVVQPVPQVCPAPTVIKMTSPPPVWPDSCVADWYAKATLPPCVESYLKQLKAQQKTIARKHHAAK